MQNSERLGPASPSSSELSPLASLAALSKRSHLSHTGAPAGEPHEDEAFMADAAHVGRHVLPHPPTLPSSALLFHLLRPAHLHAHQPSDEDELRIRSGDAADVRQGGGLRGGGPGDDRITSAPWREASEFDRPDVRYLKVKDSPEKFAVVQYGVCPFRWDSAQVAFVARPHNFYVFPRKELPKGGPSNEFLCQTTSVDFLAKYNFDFNACIHEGISYLSRVHEEEALRALSLRYGCECNNLMHVEKIPLVSASDILFTERMKIRLHVWQGILLQNSSNEDRDATSSQQQFQTVFYKLRPAILLNGFTSHQLRLIKLVIPMSLFSLSCSLPLRSQIYSNFAV